jgi:peptidoglycan/LPS O-acetylase OafA/YrhL
VVLLFVYWYIVPFVSSGPWWTLETSDIATTCQDYWWATLLYIQDFVPTDMRSECMGWTWYLANDTQFYILTPFVLYLFYKHKGAGWALLTFLILACLAVNIALVIYYNFTYYFAYYFLSNNMDFFNYLYVKPYARAFPWLVGIGLGFIFNQYGFKFQLGSVTLVVGYLLSFGTILLITFLPYNDWHHSTPYSWGYWPESVNVLFISFSRLLWSIALAWIVWACAIGYGGPINWFLAHEGWVLGARLTYSAYLIHPMIIKVYWASITSTMHYSAFYMTIIFIGTATLSFAFALLVFLGLERPSMNLERLILPR